MKKIIYIISFLGFALSVNCQNANFVISGSGVSVVSSGSTELVLNQANMINNASATAFVPSTGTVRFLGTSADASISGTQSIQFNNLRIDKLGYKVDLFTNIGVSNTAELINGNLNLINQTLDLGTTGIIAGEVYPGGRRFYCDDNQSGRIRAVRALVAGANNNIAGLQLDLNVSGTAPGSTVFLRGHDRQTSTAFLGAGTSIARYYDITPTVNTGFTYQFLFRYHDNELGGMAESGFVFYRSASHGTNTADWQEWGLGNGIESPGYPAVGLASHNTAANTVSLSGINTFSRWTVSNSAISPLPIELISFTSSCENGSIQLNWTTATEINNQRFTIYRSTDLQEWKEIITIPGAGNSNQTLNYLATDARPLDGLAYYKLVQVDFDGTSETFAPISIFCGQENISGIMSVYPNPSSDFFTISIYSPSDIESADLYFTDLNGKTLFKRNITLSMGTNNFVFDRWSMNPGTYFIQLRSTIEGIKPLKLIIQ
jgi:hypothetical protein